MPFHVWAETDAGAVRKHNEDSLVSRPDIGLWAVADGAGGHQSGEVASGMLAEALGSVPASLSPGELLADLRVRVAAVHDALREEAERRGGGAVIASTVVILIIRDDHFACLWAGDSRAYILRDGDIEQITRDHSLVQDLVDAGVISAGESETHPQANIITRAVGADAALELDKVSGKLAPGDRFLLCSDGLCKTLDAATLGVLALADGANGPARNLIEAALAQQVRDNVTAIVLEVVAEPDAD